MGTAMKRRYTIIGRVELGSRVDIHDGAIIGGAPETKGEPNERPLFIGEGTVIRENVVIHRGIEGQPQTKVGRYCTLMNGSHVAHNCELEGNVIMSSGARLAGSVYVMQFANLGIGAAVHQHTVIGSYAMIGMQAAILRHALPGMVYVGAPGRNVNFNHVGMNRYNVSREALEEETRRWEDIIREDPERLKRFTGPAAASGSLPPSE